MDDVCGRAPDGIRCAVSRSGTYGPVSLWRADFTNAGGWGASPYWQTIQFADVNGDGRDDVCGRGVTGVHCALSTGAAFAAPTNWAPVYSDANNWNLESRALSLRFPDLNGDGKADVCGRATLGLVCALSSGTAFSGSAALWTSGYSDAQGWGSGPEYWKTLRYPDLNGDGKADVCGRGANGIVCSLSLGNGFPAPTVWTSAFGDAGQWNLSEHNWGTISLPRSGRRWSR